jgi:CRISP-associated protein Cas1
VQRVRCLKLRDPIPFGRVAELIGGANPARQTAALHDAWREYAAEAARPYAWKTFHRYSRAHFAKLGEWSLDRGKDLLTPWQESARASPPVLVLGPYAALRVRGGALEIVHGPQSERRAIRIDVDAGEKPRAILFDSHGEFVTGEAIRWCARYRIVLIWPNGTDGLITTCAASRDVEGGTGIEVETVVSQCRVALDPTLSLRAAREIVRRKIEAGNVALEAFPRAHKDHAAWLNRLDGARTLNAVLIVESHAAAIYWRVFRDLGLRSNRNGELPRSWMQYPQRGRGRPAFRDGVGGGRNNASHPINAMLNYAYVVETARLMRALTARGLVLHFGFLHKPKDGRNSLVWDAIEPLRPAIDAAVFKFARANEFGRADFPQAGLHTFRLSREVTQALLAQVMLPQKAIDDATDWIASMVSRLAKDARQGETAT